MRLRLIEQFEWRACADPNRPIIRQVGSTDAVSAAELSRWTKSLAATLADAIPPGGVVLICAPNIPEFIAAFLAALSAGLKAFPVSPELAAPEIVAASERSNASAIIGTRGAIDALRNRVRRAIDVDGISNLSAQHESSRPHDAGGLLLLSSGTTGQPKIVFRNATSLDAVSEAMATAIGFTDSDHVLACVPLCHSYGIEHGLLAPLWAGSCVHLARGFELRSIVRELSDQPISILPGVPFMFEMLARHARDDAKFASLRRVYSAGGPLPRSIAQGFAERFGVTVSQLYGATEIGSIAYGDPNLDGFDPASVGRAMNGVSIRVLPPDAPQNSHALPTGDEGHVAVRAASMLSGYLDDDETVPTTIDGHFLTGDLGRLDEFGNLTITGRIKLLIDIGGLKVNPLEVEEVLAQHPGVASCIVLPVHASETVSRLKAIVAANDISAAPTPESLRAFAHERLAGYKVPRVFEVRDSLPKSPTGKILRHLVEA